MFLGIRLYKHNYYLSNNREVINEEGNVLQKNRYYPFGLPMAYDTRRTDLQPFKYNGKEFENKHRLDQYDYHTRQYDPTEIRFTTVDPLAEKYYLISPYSYERIISSLCKIETKDG